METPLAATQQYIERELRQKPVDHEALARCRLPIAVMAGETSPSQELSGELEQRWVFWYSLNQRDRGATRSNWLSQLIRSNPVQSPAEFASFCVQLLQRKVLLQESVQALMIFREGVQPLWEVPANRKGGKFAVALTSGEQSALQMYLNTVASIIMGGVVRPNDVCGIVLSFRPWGGTLTLWNSNSKDESQISRIVNFLEGSLNMTHVLYQPHKRSIALNRRKARSKNTVDALDPTDEMPQTARPQSTQDHVRSSESLPDTANRMRGRFSMSMPLIPNNESNAMRLVEPSAAEVEKAGEDPLLEASNTSSTEVAAFLLDMDSKDSLVPPEPAHVECTPTAMAQSVDSLPVRTDHPSQLVPEPAAPASLPAKLDYDDSRELEILEPDPMPEPAQLPSLPGCTVPAKTLPEEDVVSESPSSSTMVTTPLFLAPSPSENGSWNLVRVAASVALLLGLLWSTIL